MKKGKSRFKLFSKKKFQKEKKKENKFSEDIHEKIKKEIKNKKLDTPKKEDLRKYLYKLTEDYDKGIQKAKKLHEDLSNWGFRNEKIIEYKHEKIRQRSRRLLKIKRLNKKLIEQIEKNKLIEKKIEILYKKITQ